jgi:hypothetical protein
MWRPAGCGAQTLVMRPGLHRLFLCLAGFGLGCSGVQTGDSGDGDGRGCDFREEPITDLTIRPEGFSGTPEELLRPATDGITGELRLVDGRTVPVAIEFTLTDPTGVAVYRLDTPGIEDCKAEGVTVGASTSIDGGEILSATREVEIRTLDSQMWIFEISGAGGESSTSETPVFEHEPTGEPRLFVGLQRYTDGTWHGAWGWTAPWSCDGETRCSGMMDAPLGTFLAE